jgi:hypothetical protein
MSSTKTASKKGAAKKGTAKKSSSSSRNRSSRSNKGDLLSKPIVSSDMIDFDHRKKVNPGGGIKNGDLVEFTDSVVNRGVYNAEEGVIYVNGNKHTPAKMKRVDPNSLSSSEVNKLQGDQRKADSFNRIGVPHERRGENLHEHNTDLQAAISRNRTTGQLQGDANQKAFDESLIGEKANETIVKEHGLQGSGLDKNAKTTSEKKDNE